MQKSIENKAHTTNLEEPQKGSDGSLTTPSIPIIPNTIEINAGVVTESTESQVKPITSNSTETETEDETKLEHKQEKKGPSDRDLLVEEIVLEYEEKPPTKPHTPNPKKAKIAHQSIPLGTPLSSLYTVAEEFQFRVDEPSPLDIAEDTNDKNYKSESKRRIRHSMSLIYHMLSKHTPEIVTKIEEIADRIQEITNRNQWTQHLNDQLRDSKIRESLKNFIQKEFDALPGLSPNALLQQYQTDLMMMLLLFELYQMIEDMDQNPTKPLRMSEETSKYILEFTEMIDGFFYDLHDNESDFNADNPKKSATFLKKQLHETFISIYHLDSLTTEFAKRAILIGFFMFLTLLIGGGGAYGLIGLKLSFFTVNEFLLSLPKAATTLSFITHVAPYAGASLYFLVFSIIIPRIIHRSWIKDHAKNEIKRYPFFSQAVDPKVEIIPFSKERATFDFIEVKLEGFALKLQKLLATREAKVLAYENVKEKQSAEKLQELTQELETLNLKYNSTPEKQDEKLAKAILTLQNLINRHKTNHEKQQKRYKEFKKSIPTLKQFISEVQNKTYYLMKIEGDFYSFTDLNNPTLKKVTLSNNNPGILGKNPLEEFLNIRENLNSSSPHNKLKHYIENSLNNLKFEGETCELTIAKHQITLTKGKLSINSSVVDETELSPHLPAKEITIEDVENVENKGCIQPTHVIFFNKHAQNSILKKNYYLLKIEGNFYYFTDLDSPTLQKITLPKDQTHGFFSQSRSARKFSNNDIDPTTANHNEKQYYDNFIKFLKNLESGVHEYIERSLKNLEFKKEPYELIVKIDNRELTLTQIKHSITSSPVPSEQPVSQNM